MARAHIEFIQTQNVGWTPLPDGSWSKRLSEDRESGAETSIVRYPPGFHRPDPGAEERAEEFLVLEGALTCGGLRHGYHGYRFTPRGESAGARASDSGAVLIVFRYGRDDPDTAGPESPAIALDPTGMAWDMSPSDANIAHLRLARKVLRLGPNDSSRTFLLLGLPHGRPGAAEMPTEMHDHFEEMFMLQGEMWTPEGLIRPGAYFYRPPSIAHGPHVSEAGFFQIMRAGANMVRTDWQPARPLPIGQAYAPVLPPGTPPSWSAPWRGTAAF